MQRAKFVCKFLNKTAPDALYNLFRNINPKKSQDSVDVAGTFQNLKLKVQKEDCFCRSKDLQYLTDALEKGKFYLPSKEGLEKNFIG